MRIVHALAVLATLALPLSVLADTIVISSTGEGLTSGSTDVNWTVATPTAPTPVDATASTAHPAWHPETSGAGTQWINASGSGGPSQDDPSGDYSYTTSFSLAGLEASTASISIDYFVDNELNGVFVNGTQVASCGGGTYNGGGSTCVIDSSDATLNATGNTITVEVHNDGGPTGLFADVSGTADALPPSPSAVPEPSSVALLGTGILGVAGFARRKLLRS